MITNSVITVFNRLKKDGIETLCPTVIKSASWHDARSSNGGKYGDSADSFSVRIPTDADTSGKVYIDPVSWRLEGEPTKHWTIQKDDIVIRGEVTDTIQNQAELSRRYVDMFRVTSWADNRVRGSRNMKHWRIGGR